MDRVRVLRLLLPAALLLAGCRNSPYTAQYIEEVNNQNRQLEDVIYEQDYELNVLRQEVAELKRRTEAQRSERRRPSAPRVFPGVKQPPSMEPDLGPMIEIPDVPATPAEVPPPVAAPRVTPEPMPDLSPPPKSEPSPRRNPPRAPPPMDLDSPPANPLPLEEAPSRPRTNDFNPPARPDPPIPTPRIPPTDPTSLPRIEAEAPPSPPDAEALPPPLNAPSLSGPIAQPTSQPTYPTATARGDDAPPAPPTEPAKAVSIVLHPLYTGGEDTDGRPGDEGLSLLIEPRTKGGDFTPVSGKVSIAVLDPTRQGEEARVARWDFDADYVQRRMKTLTNQRGILLHTLWSNGPPKNNRLKLFVRLETADGDKLQTEREVFVALPGQLSNRWTPRTAGEAPEVARQPGAAANIGDRVLPEASSELPPEERRPTQLTPPPEAKPQAPPEPQPEIPVRKERPKKGLIVPPAALGDDPR